MTSAADLFALLQVQFWIGFVVFLRVAAVVSLLPGFGEQSVPMRVKLVIALAFTLIVAPAITTTPPAPSPGTIATLILTETLAGAMMGIGIRLFILALQTAGAIAAQDAEPLVRYKQECEQRLRELDFQRFKEKKHPFEMRWVEYPKSADHVPNRVRLTVTSRTVVWLFLEQVWL